MAKVGFIGLGIMGKPMAKNLLKAKHELVVYDIVKAAHPSLGWVPGPRAPTGGWVPADGPFSAAVKPADNPSA